MTELPSRPFFATPPSAPSSAGHQPPSARGRRPAIGIGRTSAAGAALIREGFDLLPKHIEPLWAYVCQLLDRKLQYSPANDRVRVVGRHNIKQTREEM